MKLVIGETKIKINITAAIMPVFMLIAGLEAEYAAAFLSITLHELGHIMAARACGIKAGMISVTALGFSAAVPDAGCSRGERIMICSAGPAFNLLFFLVVLLADHMIPGEQGFLRLLSASSLFLAFINLLPALPLDGGRLILELLSGNIGMLAAGRAMRVLAWLISTIIVIAGGYQLYASSYNASLIIIGLYIMITAMTGKVESALMNMKQIICRIRCWKKGYIPPASPENTRLSDTLKSMDFDRFHIVHVLDDALNIIGVFTETEIIDALISNNDDMTFERLIK